MKKIALIHDWLTVYGGAERLLKQLIAIFPTADLFTTVDFLPKKDRTFLSNTKITTSFIQKLPFARKKYRYYLSLMTQAVESFDLSDYDIVISVSHCVAKGVLTGPDQLHICICCSPVRYAWDMQHEYLEESGLDKGLKGFLAKRLMHKMRLWDYRTANSVDHFIAISDFIQRRIHKIYRRSSHTIYPPVDITNFSLNEKKEDFYLTASRFVPYKKMDLIVKTFAQMPHKKLVVIGDGPDFQKVAKNASANVKMLGYQPFEVLQKHMQKAKAFIFAPKEDFGIIPIEAQACGTPVIAYGKGGALETIQGLDSSKPTGLFFYEQSTTALQKAIEQFEALASSPSPSNCRKNALRFSEARYQKEILTFVKKAWSDFSNHPQPKEDSPQNNLSNFAKC